MLLLSAVFRSIVLDSLNFLNSLPEPAVTVSGNSDRRQRSPVNKPALQIEDTSESFTYAGHFESPFRKGGVKITRNKSSIPLYLNVPDSSLRNSLKEKSLAIVEDERETYIRGGNSPRGRRLFPSRRPDSPARSTGTYELTEENDHS